MDRYSGFIGEKKRCTVFLRDGFRCQECRRSARFYNPIKRFEVFALFCDLEVHHIRGPINDDHDNLITLCNDCHRNKAHGGSFRNYPTKIYKPKPMTQAIINRVESIFTATEYSRHGYLNIGPELLRMRYGLLITQT